MKRIIKILKSNNRKGFTLLECMAAIAIIGIMCSPMMLLFNQGITYVGKTRELDERSSSAQRLVLAPEAQTNIKENEEAVFYNVPVKIQFTIQYEDEKRKLEELTYNFQVGLSQKIVGDNYSGQKIVVKVVYFDLMQSELENLEY